VFRCTNLLSVALLALVVPVAAGQSRSAESVRTARSLIASGQLEKADTALNEALGSALYLMDSVNVFVWRGILDHLRGADSLARLNFRRALVLRQVVAVRGLDDISPGLQDLFDAEARPFRVYVASELDEPASWRSGPKLAYPAELRRRRVGGHALITAVIDTAGRVEEGSFQILESPDSAFNPPLKQMLLVAQFTPGRVKGHLVRSVVSLGFTLNPPAPENPVTLIDAARVQLRAHHADSALVLTEAALDSVNNPTPGQRVYALLVQGTAWHAKGRDSLAAQSFDDGLAGYRDLTARGVDLAPFLKRLADSIRLSLRSPRTAAAGSAFAAPTVVGSVDEPPVLVSHPPIRYAPEMQALRIGGTVVVEATLDTTGRVVPASVKVVESPNPVFNAESQRVVLASSYRPARVHSRPARVTIRQPITFAAY
jgi:TonB family protein